ncbi:MAG TPA: pilus assembly protein TadG-related protein [Gaiellaceae bacterium]|nr:pilus assembly protein TadG-related protein [Gaiellaceae bacterium]
MRAAAVRHLRREDGQTLVLTVLCLVVLLGIAALALDIGSAYVAQRRLQASADAAALAGATALPNPDAATTRANQYGSGGSNTPRGVDGVQMTVTTRCVKAAPGCSPANAIVVKESGSVQTTFGRLLGFSQLTVHATATACSPCGTRPLDIILVLDRTGSMCTDSSGAPDPTCADMTNARNGMKTFLLAMNPQLDHVGLAVLPPASSISNRCARPASSNYNSTSSPYVIVPLSNDYRLSTGQLNTSSDLVSTINCVQANGSTAYATAIDKAQAELDASGRPGVQKVIVFLSDGAANSAPSYYPTSSPYRVTPCHQGGTSAQAATAAGTKVFSIGYDLEHDVCKNANTGGNEAPAITAEQALRAIASTSSDFYNQPDAAQLNSIYASIAADLLAGTSQLVDDDAP